MCYVEKLVCRRRRRRRFRVCSLRDNENLGFVTLSSHPTNARGKQSMLDRDRLVNNICSEVNCTIIDDRSWLHSVVQPGFLFAGGGGGGASNFTNAPHFELTSKNKDSRLVAPPPPHTHTHSIYAIYCIIKPTSIHSRNIWGGGGGLGQNDPLSSKVCFVLLCFVLFWGLAIQKEAMCILCPLDCTFFQSFCSLHHCKCKRQITDIVRFLKIELYCMCCIMLFRWINKNPGTQKFFNWCGHYQDTNDWISPLNKPSGLWFVLTQQSSSLWGNEYGKSGHYSIFTFWST